MTSRLVTTAHECPTWVLSGPEADEAAEQALVEAGVSVCRVPTSAEGRVDIRSSLEQLADAGIVLCYHNHAFEFETFDGKYGLDILYDNSDPQYVQAEIDTYWVQKGGVDPAAYIRKLSGRTPLIHIKDMDTDGDFAEIGEGTLDWDAIWSACEASGAKWYIVEQDRCKRPPVESATLSVNNLCKMGKLD